jgi:sulfide:quinone oxidoreductase
MIEGAVEALNDPDCPAGSMYTLEWTQKISQLRENYKGGKAVFTVPGMPIKCGGAPQKVMYLSEEYWRKKGIQSDIHFYTSTPVIFPPCKKFSDALLPIA